MGDLEFLVGYGLVGEFGRFRSTRPLACRRGDRVVVRTHRGVEAGAVLRPAAPAHAQFLPNTTVGQLLRPFGADDERTATRLLGRAAEVQDRATQLATELDLPLELLDVEMLLDGEHAVLHHLRWAECDPRPFVSTLSREFALHVLLTDLTNAGSAAMHEDAEEEHSCGSCGSSGDGCGSCGSGGGCGSCATARPPVDAAHFAGLREQMERQRTPLN